MIFKDAKIGNQELENWLATQLEPRVDFRVFQFLFDEVPIVIVKIDPALMCR